MPRTSQRSWANLTEKTVNLKICLCDLPVKSVNHVLAPREPCLGKDPVLGRNTLRGIAGYKDVSRYQARIFKDASGWVMTSLEKSTHPTRLNGSVIKLSQRYPLSEGDVIEIGRLRVTVAFEYDEV